MINQLLAFVLVALVTNACIANDRNIIKNGGFENGDSAYISKSWKDNSRWADVDVTYSRFLSKERKGFVQKIGCDRFKNGAVQFVQAGVALQSGDIYKVSFWAKGNIDVPLQVLLRKHGKPYIVYHSKAFKITSEWRQYSYVAPIHVDDDSAYLMFKYTSRGDVFLDDVSVSLADFSKITAKHQEGNLLANGSFEVGVDKWGVQFRGAGAEYEMPVRAMELSAEIDDSRVKYGNYSLKIPSVKKSRFILNSENVTLSPGVKYSLSFWLYSEKKRNIKAGIVSGYLGGNRSRLETMSVGPKWRQYRTSIIAKPSEDNAYFIVIKGHGAGAVWVDGVQLEEGKIEPFSTKSFIETGFSKFKSHPVFVLHEEISLKLHVAANKQVKDCKVKVDSIDFYGRKKTVLQQKCGLSQSLRSEINVLHPSGKSGYFRLVAEVSSNGKVVDSSEYAIAVVPELAAATRAENIASSFGGHGRFTDGDLKTLSRLGVKWLRMHPPLGTKWSVVEKIKGDFNYSDKQILLAKKAGFQILGSLDKTPRWASTAPSGERRFWSYPPENMDDWENYVFNIVSHYKGVIDYWEVWNEPDSDGFLKVPGILGSGRKPEVYVELLKRAYRAARRANPDAVIVGGVATGHPPSRWLKQIFDKGALAYVDVVSFHHYTDGRPGDALDTPLSVEIANIKDLIKQKARKVVPLWETESGIMQPETSYTNLKEISPLYSTPDVEAVAYLVRHYVHLLSNGVDKWFYYSMFTSPRIDRREATGFFEWDGAPRPLSVAYAVLSSNLSGLTYSSSYDLNKMVIATKFSSKNRDLLVVSAKLWKVGGFYKVSLDKSSDYSGYKIFNVMGNEINFSMSDNSLEFEIGREPVYVFAYRSQGSLE